MPAESRLVRTIPRIEDYPALSDRTYQLIREQIVTGALPAGSRLGVGDLAKQIGVSRTPVIYALNRLLSERLVDSSPRRGYSVANVSAEMFVDLMNARRLIESAAAEEGLAVSSPRDLAEVRRWHDSFAQMVADGRFTPDPELTKADIEFHSALVASAHNRHLLDVYARLQAHLHMRRVWAIAATPDHSLERQLGPAAVREHAEIIAAFESRDRSALKSAIEYHIESNIKAHMRSWASLEATPLRPEPKSHRGEDVRDGVSCP